MSGVKENHIFHFGGKESLTVMLARAASEAAGSAATQRPQLTVLLLLHGTLWQCSLHSPSHHDSPIEQTKVLRHVIGQERGGGGEARERTLPSSIISSSS